MDLSAQEIESQGTIWGLMLAFADSAAIKSAIELRLADIIQSHEVPITLSQIASAIDSPTPPNTDYLHRILRYLVNKKIFSATTNVGNGETVYGPTPLSKMISNDFELSLAPTALLLNHPLLQASWHCFSKCVKEGGAAFRTAHGCDLWELTSKDDHYDKLLRNGMASSSHTMNAIIVAQYKGFETIESLVDVGGGTGKLLESIVKEHPHIKAMINFDLPHVIATAPEIPGITHVGGNMFESVPAGQALVLKWIMHDWTDKECIQILKNCRKAIPENGKIILIDIILQQKEDGSYCDCGLKFDLLMFAFSTGKERTEQEWKYILNEGGFTRYKIIPDILLSTSIIEACP